mmetsp:Transcript_83715/g.157614  ORF Transcript_83715/g.157614 Transcript_83715/m.157614 type:complete len:94 (+) Transcript_83715:1290-1571(+)
MQMQNVVMLVMFTLEILRLCPQKRRVKIINKWTLLMILQAKDPAMPPLALKRARLEIAGLTLLANEKCKECICSRWSHQFSFQAALQLRASAA